MAVLRRRGEETAPVKPNHDERACRANRRCRAGLSYRGAFAAVLAYLAMSMVVAPAVGRLADAFANLDPLPEAELAAQRGGFTVGGISFRFGAQVRTFVDGRLALETRLVPDATGNWVRVADAGLSGAGGETNGQASGVSVFESVAVGDGRTLSRQIGGGASANGLPADLREVVRQGSGIVLEDADGVTTVLHQLPSGVPANLVISSGSGRTIVQSTTIDIGIENFESVSQAAARARLAEIGRLSGQPELIQALP